MDSKKNRKKAAKPTSSKQRKRISYGTYLQASTFPRHKAGKNRA